jgi:TonB family protein
MVRRLTTVAAAGVLTVGSLAGLQARSQSTSGAQQAQAQARQAEEPVYTPGKGVTPPKLVKEVPPVYTSRAMQADIVGEVVVEAVVTTEGAVRDVEIVKSLDQQYGLDDAAVEAAKQWRFEPGMLDGAPVNTRIQIVLDFRMHEVPEREPRSGARPAPVSNERVENRGRTQTLEEFERGAWREGAEGVVAPTRRRIINPRYTADAMRQKIQGFVGVDVVVMPDGTVDRARIAESLDTEYGLDEQALAAAMASTFEPNSGTLGGNPVPVIVRLNLDFRIH